MYQKLFLIMLPALVAAGPGINPNPNPRFNPATSKGTFGPFVIPQAASPAATGGPLKGSVDARVLQAMQLAISNWQTDTGIVSLFQNQGPITTDDAQFKGIADGAFKAEVDELTQKAVLDQVIGNDPRVSLANLTLTNGVFQSVVDNLQIMSIQGQKRANLVDTINQVRCTQILPSIDTYMIVAAEYIGDNAQQRRAVRPNACVQILAAANASAFAALPVSFLIVCVQAPVLTFHCRVHQAVSQSAQVTATLLGFLEHAVKAIACQWPRTVLATLAVLRIAMQLRPLALRRLRILLRRSLACRASRALAF
jgi:hypothetical protein